MKLSAIFIDVFSEKIKKKEKIFNFALTGFNFRLFFMPV